MAEYELSETKNCSWYLPPRIYFKELTSFAVGKIAPMFKSLFPGNPLDSS
jgi:hypothetical protein